MEQKPKIIYIKNNKEYKVELNIFNYKEILNEILEPSKTYYAKINKDIEYIHFININLPMLCKIYYNFKSLEGLETKNDTLCVFENCNLKFRRKYIDLKGGTYQIINKKTQDEIKMNTKTCKEIIIDNSKIENPIRKTEISTINNDNFSINDNKTIKELLLIAHNATLLEDFELDYLSIITKDKIVLGDINKFTSIIMTNKNFYDITLKTEELKIANAVIINNSKRSIKIKYSNIKAINFTIRSKGPIIINKSTVFNKFGKDGYITVTDKDLLRIEVSNKLKMLLTTVNQQIETYAKKQTKIKENKDLSTLIEFQKEKVEQEQEYLEELKSKLFEENEETRKNEINKLLRKKVKEINRR